MPPKSRGKGKGMRSKYAFPEWPGLVIFQREDAGDNWYVRFPIKVKGLRPYKIQLLREGGEENGSPTTSLETAKQWALFDKSLEDVITEYVAEVQSDRTRGKTAVKRATMAAIPLKRYFKAVGIRLIARITTEVAKGYIDWRHKQVTYRGRTIAPTTVMHEMQILNQIFDYAIDKRYMRHEDRPKATFSVSLKNRTKRDGFTTEIVSRGLV